MTGNLSDYFNRQPRTCVLATTSRTGKVDVAVFGSPFMPDERTVVMGLARNRTLTNLESIPNAVFMVVQPGREVTDWLGVRVYVRVQDVETEGQTLDTLKKEVTAVAGEMAAGMIHAAVRFRVIEVRPLIDMGQGWERSI